MKVCERAINFAQIINAEGDLRICSWMASNLMGNLMCDDFKTMLSSEKFQKICETFEDGTYTYCIKDNCPWLANNEIEKHLIEIDEIPDYPQELHLAYEGVCNYRCTVCSSYQHMEETKLEDKSQKYDALEKKIKEIMPHVRRIGANGRGELFASKRTLKLLSEWRPLAPQDEISVLLETNGSLFDEAHWKQIENLGQYDLSVALTVMSFDEPVYQYLSGTKLPISRLEDNLRYVKKLREEGVINYLELATVLQEANFREMPSFTKRCLKEFGADNVRIRPVRLGGKMDFNIEWFMDVRNPDHPYYEDYCKIMQNPIFKDERVLLWSADLPSGYGEHPGIKRQKIQQLTDCILSDKDIINTLKNIAEEEKLDCISIYGIGTIGKLLTRLLDGKVRISSIYDMNATLGDYNGVAVKHPCESKQEVSIVFVTVYGGYREIVEKLRNYGYKGKIVNLYNLIC